MGAACQKATNLEIFPTNRQTDRQTSKLIVHLQFIWKQFISRYPVCIDSPVVIVPSVCIGPPVVVVPSVCIGPPVVIVLFVCIVFIVTLFSLFPLFILMSLFPLLSLFYCFYCLYCSIVLLFPLFYCSIVSKVQRSNWSGSPTFYLLIRLLNIGILCIPRYTQPGVRHL